MNIISISTANLIYITLLSVAVLLSIFFFMIRKNARNGRAIIHGLSFVVALSLLGCLGLLQEITPRTLYIILLISFFLMGLIHTWLLYKGQPWSRRDLFFAETLFTLAITCMGATGFLAVYQLLTQTEPGWVMTGSALLFFFPFLLHKTFFLWKAIPAKIYYIWQYLEYMEVPELIPSEAIRVHFRIARDGQHDTYSKFTIRAPMNMKFGDVFHYFVHDYNSEHPSTRIVANTEHQPFGWHFYTRKYWWKKQVIDPNMSVYRNQLKDNVLISAKRVYLDY